MRAASAASATSPAKGEEGTREGAQAGVRSHPLPKSAQLHMYPWGRAKGPFWRARDGGGRKGRLGGGMRNEVGGKGEASPPPPLSLALTLSIAQPPPVLPHSSARERTCYRARALGKRRRLCVARPASVPPIASAVAVRWRRRRGDRNNGERKRKEQSKVEMIGVGVGSFGPFPAYVVARTRGRDQKARRMVT